MSGVSGEALAAGTYAELYPFTGGPTGANPAASLVADEHGALYGSATTGGDKCSASPTSGCGTIFKRDPTGKVSVVYSFQGGSNGSNPYTDLTLTRHTLLGGAYILQPSGNINLLLGVLYSVLPDGTGYSIIHTFDGYHGRALTGQLQPSANGGLFGVSQDGGPEYTPQAQGGNGVLFYLSPSHAYRIVHHFTNGTDGQYPSALLQDATGALFGSTVAGGDACTGKTGCGTIFEYVPSTRTYSILYRFTDGADGAHPTLGSIGPDGTLYGVTGTGTATPHGTLFSVAPAGGKYRFTTLTPIRSHMGGETDRPTNAPVLTSRGALVGATGLQLYSYVNGRFVTLLDLQQAGIGITGQLLTTPDGLTAYGTAQYGGTGKCPVNTQNGCGNLFSFYLGAKSP